MFNSQNPKLARNTLPIKDDEIISFVKETDKDNFLNNSLQNIELKEQFLKKYFSWISTSKLNVLKGLDRFDNLSYVHGTSQSFDAF